MNELNSDLGNRPIVRQKLYAVNCNGQSYTVIKMPDNSFPIVVMSYRTEVNNYHYIKGFAQLIDTDQLFLYYDAENSGDHLITFTYFDNSQ